MRLFLRTYFLIIILLIPLASGFSANIEVAASVDTTEYLIGDWIQVDISAVHPQELIVFPPDLGEKAGDLEVIRLLAFKPEVSENTVKSKWRLTLAAFDTGAFTIPPFEIGYHVAGDSVTSTTETDPLNVFVYSAGGDTLQAPHDIKPQMDAPLEFADFLPYIIALIIAAAIVLFIWWWKKRKKEKPAEDEIPDIPQIDPFEHAMKRFVQLENKQLATKGFVKEYWSELTEIVREYFELALHIPALEMTTDEFFEAVTDEDTMAEKSHREMFITADLVKFAKLIPTRKQCLAAMQNGQEIVRQARPIMRTASEVQTVLEQSKSEKSVKETEDSTEKE